MLIMVLGAVQSEEVATENNNEYPGDINGSQGNMYPSSPPISFHSVVLTFWPKSSATYPGTVAYCIFLCFQCQFNPFFHDDSYCQED